MNENTIPKFASGWQVAGKLIPILKQAKIESLRLMLEGVPIGNVPAVLVEQSEKVQKILAMEGPKTRATRCDKGTKRTPKIAPVEPSKPDTKTPVLPV